MKHSTNVRLVLGFAFSIMLVLTGAQCTKSVPSGTTEKAMNINTGAVMQKGEEKTAETGLPMENKEGVTQKEQTKMTDKKEVETTTVKADEKVMREEKESVVSATGQYLVYSPDIYEQYKNQKRVLYFHAPWCPTCKAANLDFAGNAASIPVGIVVLKTDYDTEKELKQKYSVTYQHTFVQIDANGNAVTKWNGGGVQELAANVK